MITFIEGSLVEKQPTRVVVNVGGVGYEAFIPLSSFDRLPKAGETIRLLTYDCVREDDHLLYGFMTEGERRMFVLLLTVSGIGPKLALSALSGLSARDLKASIVGSDVKRLSSVPGIGKKTAERMIVELRDKIGAGEAMEAATESRELSPDDLKVRDAVLALISLGYKRVDAQRMIKDVLDSGGGPLTVEELVRKSLAQ